jgi:hypothetical protein|tara:strand:- start:106 stop:441 length:336 start_codon:yes stop_codon:yes gene_type:complete
MKAHVIENNVVVNTIEVDSLDFMPNLVEATEGSKGWSYVDGVFTEPVDTTTDAELAEEARTERDSRLAVTDFHGLTDNTMSEAMTTYRQALRDVPAQGGFPNTITWPTEPS